MKPLFNTELYTKNFENGLSKTEAIPLPSPRLSEFSKYYNVKYDCKTKSKQPLLLVNDMRIRNFLCFFTPLLLMCNQRKLLKLPKISAPEFDMDNHKKTLVSKNLKMVSLFVGKKEPKEIIIPLSEICHYLSDKKLLDREQKIIYWLAWLIEYEKIYHNKMCYFYK